MDVSETKRLRALEDENRKLKPHSSLGYKTPAAHAGTTTAPKGVTLAECSVAAG
jgi:hypothetical protein